MRKRIKCATLIAMLAFVIIIMAQNGSMNELISLANDMLLFAKAMIGVILRWICFFIESICKIALALFGV